MNNQLEKSINCCVTSPPYNLSIKYGTYQDDLPRDSYLKWLNDVAIALKRVLKDDGHLFLNVGYSNVDPWVAMDVAQVFRQSFVLQNNFTWVKHILLNDKTHGIFKPINSNRFASPTTESIFHFTKDGNIPVDRLAIGHRNETHDKWPELYSEGRHIANQRRKAAKKLGFKDWIDVQKNATVEQQNKFKELLQEYLDKNPWDADKKKCIGNAWYVPYKPVSQLAKESGETTLGDRESGRGGHPATFPDQLPEMCIKFSGITHGSVVYDPFVGTGTTIVSGLKLGMRCIGTDLDSDYLKFAESRIKNIINNDFNFKSDSISTNNKNKINNDINTNLFEIT